MDVELSQSDGNWQWRVSLFLPAALASRRAIAEHPTRGGDRVDGACHPVGLV